MTKGFRDKEGTFHPIKKGTIKISRKKKSIKPQGVRVTSVTLTPQNIKKINKRRIKEIEKGRNVSFSESLNDLLRKA